jgi:hypothetical protein
MDPKQFKENLLAFGSDISKWPAGMREAGLKALRDTSEFRTLLADEERFEEILKSRRFEEPSRDLPDRIISASQRGKKKTPSPSGIGGFLSELLWEFRLPKPALAAVSALLICFLIIGFAIGFSNQTEAMSAEPYQTNLEDFLYYEGEEL